MRVVGMILCCLGLAACGTDGAPDSMKPETETGSTIGVNEEI